METQITIKGGIKEMELFLKADIYFNTITPKWWNMKGGKIELLLRHPDEIKLSEGGIYSIDEIITALDKFDKKKKYVNKAEEQAFQLAYQEYKESLTN